MRLNVRQWGAGERTALLVHGLFSDSSCWHHVGPRLATSGYRVLAPDLRGHGHSGRGRYTPADWGLDLIDTFLEDTIDLALGHSLGGLALSVATHALRPRRSIYMDPAWRMNGELSAQFLVEWTRWLQWTDIEQLRTTLGQGWDPADVMLRWESMWRCDPSVVAGLAVAGGYDYSPEDAPTPTLVLAADPSQYITAEHAARLVERGLEVETIPGSGHSWFREDGPAFLARIDKWLKEDPAAHTIER